MSVGNPSATPRNDARAAAGNDRADTAGNPRPAHSPENGDEPAPAP